MTLSGSHTLTHRHAHTHNSVQLFSTVMAPEQLRFLEGRDLCDLTASYSSPERVGLKDAHENTSRHTRYTVYLKG